MLWVVRNPVLAVTGSIIPIQQNIQLVLPTNTPTPTPKIFTPIQKLPIDIKLVVTNTPTPMVTPTIAVSPTTMVSENQTLMASPTEKPMVKNEATDTATRITSSKDKMLLGFMVTLAILLVIAISWSKIKVWLHKKTE